MTFNELKLEIFESCERGEITEEEKNELLERVYVQEAFMNDEEESFTLEEAMNFIDDHLSKVDNEKEVEESVSLDEMKMAIYEKELAGEITVEEREELIDYVESLAVEE